jgi:hypothetical protein
LLLGNGGVIESNAVPVPVEAASDQIYSRTSEEGLHDEPWYESLDEPTSI